MSETDQVEIYFEVNAADAIDEELDSLTRPFLLKLRETGIELEQIWAVLSQRRTVKFEAKGVEFEGSPQEFQKLLASLEEQKKKKT